MNGNLVETLIGALVITVAVVFFGFAYSTTDLTAGSNGYEVIAKFDSVDGVSPGSDVRMSGIKVGTVTDMKLDPKTYRAVVTIGVRSDIELPEDTSIKVTSEGLLGGNYLALVPGGSFDLLGPGDEIEYTQGSVDLMGLLGQAVFSATEQSE